MKKHLDNEDFNNEDSKHCSIPISLMLQFLFHELRHSDSIKRWLYKKLSLEFDELLTKTTTGKFFEAVNVRLVTSTFHDLNLHLELILNVHIYLLFKISEKHFQKKNNFFNI